MLVWWLAFQSGLRNPLILPVAVLVTIWGVRLAYHIGRRDFAHGRGEDPRYAAWRAEWKFFVLRSYLQVFLLQGFFMLLVSTPLIVLAASSTDNGVVAAVVGRRGLGRRLRVRVHRRLAARVLPRRAPRDPGTGHGPWPVGLVTPSQLLWRVAHVVGARNHRAGCRVGMARADRARPPSRCCWCSSRASRSPRPVMQASRRGRRTRPAPARSSRFRPRSPDRPLAVRHLRTEEPECPGSPRTAASASADRSPT